MMVEQAKINKYFSMQEFVMFLMCWLSRWYSVRWCAEVFSKGFKKNYKASTGLVVIVVLLPLHCYECYCFSYYY